MGKFADWLREKENKFKYLPDVIVNNKLAIWNKSKTEQKFLQQINERIKAAHITDSAKLGEILQRGLNLKYNEYASGKGRSNDTCIRFKKSQFVVIFNKDEHSIIGIRVPLNNLRCNKEKVVMESLEAEEQLFKDLCIKAFDINEPEDGILMTINENDRIVIQNVCKICIEIDL